MSELADLVLAAPPRLGAVRLVAIDGPSGSGKSTLAAALAAELGERVAVVPTDHFATWADPVSWWPQLVDGVLRPLARGEAGRYRSNDWSDGMPRLGDWVEIGRPSVLVVEGVSSGRRSVRAELSALVWVELTAAAERLARSVARDGASTKPDFVRWQAFELGWFAVDGTKAAADVVIESR